jgi:ankyrin repeat protein
VLYILTMHALSKEMGHSALAEVCGRGHTELFKYLVARGANIHTKNVMPPSHLVFLSCHSMSSITMLKQTTQNHIQLKN